MTELKTEEEQIEAFKTWWKKNGTSLIIVIAVAVAAYLGFQAWQKNQANHLEEASVLFQSMSAAAADLTDEKKAQTLSFISNQLITDYDDTGYATFAYLYQAKAAVVTKDYDAALVALKAAKDSTDDVSLKAIADLRIAKLLFVQNKLDEALAQLELVTLTEYDGQKYETQGDILLAQNKQDDARIAYKKASEAKGSTPTPLLNIKIQDLVEN